MATDSEISANAPISVFKMTPVDVSMMRDPGMRAIVLLAVSLGWNALHKPNSPVFITARDGTQRRLPTNTSVRMSVFQAALSTIMVHTDDREATPELIDEIVRETKIDRDHERRLRLAIGESAEDHRKRLANQRAAEQKREPEEHLTQRPAMPQEVRAETVFTPYDEQDHGRLISRAPFVAHFASNKYSSMIYQSDSSLERVWEDGYKDYECPVCGKVFGSPRGAGSHRQVHYKSGEIEYEGNSAERAQARGTYEVARDPERPKAKRRTKAEVRAERAAGVPAVSDLIFEELPPEPPTEEPLTDAEWEPYARAIGAVDLTEKAVETIHDQGDIISQIAAIVSPQIIVSRDTWKRIAEAHAQTIDELTTQLDEKTTELQKLKADWDALRGLIDNR